MKNAKKLMARFDTAPLRPAIKKHGQAYFDECVKLQPLFEDGVEAAVREAFGRPKPQALSYYERTLLDWGGKEGGRP